MDPGRVSTEEEDRLDDTNLEVHPSLTFEESEVVYLGVNFPDPIIEEDNNDQPDPNNNPW